MINHHFVNPTFARIRDFFVFGSLTGISFIDIKNLTTDNLENTGGGWWITSKRQKTGVPFRVKLLDSAYQIIERHEPYRKDNHLFNFPSNQRTNVVLKRIVKDCGLGKSVTFHQSRHSFATLAMSKGMPIESVSKILGHTNITTTQIYAKVTAEKIEQDMATFGEKLEAGFAKAQAQALTPTPTPTIIQMPTASRRSRNEAVN